jgi:hypothetical protein
MARGPASSGPSSRWSWATRRWRSRSTRTSGAPSARPIKVYVAVAYERLGRIAERQGNADEAIAYYGRFLDMWVDADPELAPLRDEVRQRRDALWARQR